MNNAIATFTEVLDMGSATMIHWNGEAVTLTWVRNPPVPLNYALDFGTRGAVHEVGGRGPEHESACHLRRGNRQTAANAVAAKIQTEAIIKLSNVRWGSKSEVAGLARHVRSTLNSRHRQAAPACPFRAFGHGGCEE